MWPLVEKGLQKIIEKCGKQPWEPIHVRRAIERGYAFLHACPDGFFIVEKREDWGAFYLNIWCMYFEPREGLRRREALVEQFDAIKKAMFCEFISFTSPRAPWTRAMEKYFKPYATTYRRE